MAESPLRWDLQHKDFLDSFDRRVRADCIDHRYSSGQVGNHCKSLRSFGFSLWTLVDRPCEQ